MKILNRNFDISLPEFPEQVLKFCVFLVSCIALATIITAALNQLINPVLHTQGEVANYTVRSPRDILIEDTLSTEKKRTEAISDVPQVLRMNSSAGSLTEELEAIFATLQERTESLQEKEGAAKDAVARERTAFERQFNLNFTNVEWEILFDRSLWVPLENTVAKITRPLLEQGIIANKKQLAQELEPGRKVILFDPAANSEREITSLTQLRDVEEAKKLAKEPLSGSGASYGPAFDSVLEKLVHHQLRPNVSLDAQEMQNRIKLAERNIEPIFYRIKRGEVIVRSGDVINITQERRLKQLYEELGGGNLVRPWLGYFVLCGLILLAVYSFTTSFWPDCRPSARDLLVIALTLVGSLMLIKGFSVLATSLSNMFFYFDPNTFILAAPVATGGILLQVTLGGSAVFIFLMTFALITGVFLENSWMVLALIMIGNIVGPISVRDCTKRSGFLLAGARVAAINMLIVLCFLMLYPEYTSAETANRLLWAIVGGLASGVLGVGLTPIAEFFGGYVTDIKLLELASLDHPLLRDLSVQAPGTWNHSVVLGQMCEAAAEACGAKPLLARVGAYYHDIGKSRKPAYFVENQTKENRHDKLTPSMSALIIKTHVKDGMELAEQAHVPQTVIDFIPEHHGTSLIKYFYEKAQKEAAEGDVVDEGHYRYAGPKPQSKETAILMLADAVEAASRTVADPTPAKLQGLVQKIINNVFASGELDESNLTLKDLHLIAKSFTRVLSGIYHRRIEYSEPAEKGREAKTARQPKPGQEGEKQKRESGGVKKNGGRASAETNGSDQAEEAAAKKGDPGDPKETLKRLGI